MSNEDIAALGERISRLEMVVTRLAERAQLDIPQLISQPPASGTGFASDGGPTGFASDATTGFASVDAARDPQVLDLINRDDVIRAIKRYRELTGSGLAEAKDAVERIARGE